MPVTMARGGLYVYGTISCEPTGAAMSRVGLGLTRSGQRANVHVYEPSKDACMHDDIMIIMLMTDAHYIDEWSNYPEYCVVHSSTEDRRNSIAIAMRPAP